MILVTKWFGVFLCEKDKVIKHSSFEKDPKAIAQKLASVQLWGGTSRGGGFVPEAYACR